MLAYDRVLKVDLDGCISLLEATKWKFYEVNDDHVRVEVPKDRETLVVELGFKDVPTKQHIIDTLRKEGFNEQEIRPWRAS